MEKEVKRKSAKEAFLKGFVSSLVAGITGGILGVVFAAIMLIFGIPASVTNILGNYNTLKCEKLWVVEDDSKTGMLLTVNDEGGLLTVYDKTIPDYETTVSVSIRKSGGEFILAGAKGMVTISAGNGDSIRRNISTTKEPKEDPDERDKNFK